VTVGQQDFSAVLSKVRELKPEGIYYGGVVTEGAGVRKQANKLGLTKVMFMGPPGIQSDTFGQLIGADAEAAFCSGTFDVNSSAQGKAFVKAYAAKYPNEPFEQNGPYAYDSAAVILEALKAVGPDRAKIIDYIRGHEFKGVIGDIKWDNAGQNKRGGLTMYVNQSGKWMKYEESEYAAGILVIVLLFLVVSALTGAWGIVIYRLLVRPLLGAPRLILLLATVAAGQVIREVIRVVYPNGSNPQVFPKILPEGGLSLAGLDVGYDAISIVLITLGVILGLNFVILRTRMGMAMRAVSQNADVAQMMGVNMDRTVTIVFVIGSALAGLAGLLNGSYYGITKFSIGSSLGIKGFSAAVIGGLGDFYGAIMGGVLLGFIEVFSAAYIPEGSQYQDVFSFLAVILFLLFRPRGILGERTYEKV
jgi:branched-chain amino acid transport system permease protein